MRTELQDLLNTPDLKRDQLWEDRFFVSLTQTNLKVLDETPQVGPDGWPYLLTEIDPSSTESAQKILHWLSLRGIGLVVNPHKDYPDFVFNYGMIWFFRKTGFFYQRIERPVTTGPIEFFKGQKLYSGAPSEDYLPQHVRTIIKNFFLDQGILRPRLLMVSNDNIHFELALSIESLGNPPQKEHLGIAEAVSWFLPAHYPMVLLQEKDLPGFVDL
ncbi:MAG: hypothetical protein ACOYOK_08615 [Pseudobdellovibrionaceae bacterium]